jgi:cell wall assembly regulator SMI1
MDIDMAGVWNRIEAWYATNAPGSLASLAPAAPRQDIDDLELALGRSIPPDYRSSLERHNGGAFVRGSAYLDAAWAKRLWGSLNSQQERGLFSTLAPGDMSGSKFAPVWWSAGWLPVAEHRAGTITCLDLAPGPEGMVGQVLQLDLRDEGPGLTRWKSFAEWLEDYCNDLKRGRYEVDAWGNLSLRS